MKIITLGTSHGAATKTAFTSSTAIECSDGSLYLVDAGEPAGVQMLRADCNFDKLRALFITHIHGDHVGGLPSLLLNCCIFKHSENRIKILTSDNRIVQPTADFCKAIGFDPSEFADFETVKAGRIYEDDSITADAITTNHTPGEGTPSFAYLITEKATGKRLLCTGDLAPDFSDFPADVPADACVCEATHYSNKVAAPILVNCNYKLLVFNHVHTPWQSPEGAMKWLSPFDGVNYTMRVAHDLDVFEF